MASALVQFRDAELDKQFAERTIATPLMVRAQTEKLSGEEAKEEERERSRLFSTVAERDLERYYKAIIPTLYAINLSYGEAMIIVDALNGYLMTPELPQVLVHNVRDSMELNHTDETWNVDRDAFMKRLEQLSPIECLAINDAVERWWNASTYYISQENETYEQRCIHVGLIRPPRRNVLTPETV